VSKATKRHCAGTVQSQGGRVGHVKQVGFEPGPEDSYVQSPAFHIHTVAIALCEERARPKNLKKKIA